MIRVLTIGQLPKEAGGNHTTGVANVVYELSKQKLQSTRQYLYATNMPYDRSVKISSYPNQYIGYRFLVFRMLFNMISHPLKTMRQWIHYKKVCHANPLRYEFYKANIELAIKTVNPDIIHIHGVGTSPLYFAKKNKSIPIIRTYHGIIFKSDGDTKYQQVGDEAIGTKDFVNFYTALTEENKLEVSKLGISLDRISVIPNGVDSTKFYFDNAERQRIRHDFNVRENTIVFMTVGRLIDRKGQLSFLKLLSTTQLDFQYWMLGNGPDYDNIQSFIVKHNLNDKVKLLGQVNGLQLYKFYSAADFYAHSSTTEGQSLAEIEAFATGLRIIVNKMISGTVIGDCVNSPDIYYVLDFNNFHYMDFMKWINMPTNVRNSRSYCDWSSVASQYERLYYKILENYNR